VANFKTKRPLPTIHENGKKILHQQMTILLHLHFNNFTLTSVKQMQTHWTHLLHPLWVHSKWGWQSVSLPGMAKVLKKVHDSEQQND